MSIIQKNNHKSALVTTAAKLLNKPLLNSIAMLAMVLGVAQQATARDYKVEVILFENNNPSTVTESHDYEPPKRMTSGSKTWRLSPTMLNKVAQTLDKSSDYEVMQHYSWGVESLRYQDSANYRITERDAQGYIKIYADQLLFANIDLDYKGFRMQEKRRLKLNEKHFFDHPKFGLLLQVSRLEPIKKPSQDSTAELNSSR